MHYLVRLIVEADNATEANSKADNVMSDLVEWNEFDCYYSETDDSRWPDCWKPVRLSAKKAQSMAIDAMQGQLAEFKQALATIRFMLEQYSDEQIFNEDFKQDIAGHYLSRYQFSRASGYHANACQLFDTNGSAITNQRELDLLLKESEGLWVVQVDCHN
ncbi:hypothetical protein AUK57_00715 [Candidatus Saccharibacteria bacterium CG2_30_41_52]|nr:MAG: hypothetical protein AUK57_00715 [Candidatus Saccharibacteria bacterium CG2_30_41_52]